MHSKRRYKICISRSVFGHSRGTWVFSKLRGIQNYFPENFRCNLTYYEGNNFLDSFFHHIFELENFRIPYLRKMPNPGEWNVKNWASKIVHEWNGDLEIFSQEEENSRQNLLLRTDILQKSVVGCPWPELWKTTIGLIAAHFFVHFLAADLHDYNVKRRETSWFSRFIEETWYMFLFTFTTAASFF